MVPMGVITANLLAVNIAMTPAHTSLVIRKITTMAMNTDRSRTTAATIQPMLLEAVDEATRGMEVAITNAWSSPNPAFKTLPHESLIYVAIKTGVDTYKPNFRVVMRKRLRLSTTAPSHFSQI
jgi:hypothetical protein